MNPITLFYNCMNYMYELIYSYFIHAENYFFETNINQPENKYDLDIIREKFDLTELGFLPVNNITKLNDYFAEWDRIANNLSTINKDKKICEYINNLELLDYQLLQSDNEYRRAYLILSLISHSYIFNNSTGIIPNILPAQLAIPWWHISAKIGIKPILTHACVDLYNWQLINKNNEITLENLKVITSMTGTSDEHNFYLITTEIESYGGKVIEIIFNILNELHNENSYVDSQLIINNLIEFDEIQTILNNVVMKMFNNCDPEIFYNVLRPYLKGSAENSDLPDGLLYEGVSEQPYKFFGGSAAQSSFIQLLDVFLGIKHESTYLKNIREYMPIKHLEFLEYVEKINTFPEFVRNYYVDDENDINDQNDIIEIKDRIQKCVKKLQSFRLIHMGFATKYIIGMMPDENDNQKGTGGTNLKQFLSEIIEETKVV